MIDLSTYGLKITSAYKDLSQHYQGQISVSVHAKGIFNKCRTVKDISESWVINDKVRLCPLYGYNGECYVPKDILAQWITELPIKYESYNVDKMPESELLTAIELAKKVDSWIDILNTDGTPYDYYDKRGSR